MSRPAPRFLVAVTLVALTVAPLWGANGTVAEWGQEIPTATPEEVGLSQERLDRIGRIMQAHVDEGRVTGAMGLIIRRGRLAWFETWGHQDREAGVPMKEDTIFRLASMSKAITGVALMILHEEQRFSLNASVSRWLPELGDLQVAVDRTNADTGVREYRLEPARRDISVVDLLSHSSGLSYDGPRNEAGMPVYEELGIRDEGLTLAEIVTMLGEAPLHNHPGTVWRYGFSIDVVGRLVEVMSGRSFGEFLEERLFEPLGMKDTAFWVPESKASRLTVLYKAADDGTIERSEEPQQTVRYLSQPSFESGGGGLVTTATDYLRFCQMLLNGGELGGRRILGRKSVELMSSDHIGDRARVTRPGLLGAGDGFGLTFRINKSPGRNAVLGSKGAYSWGGAGGSRFNIDPHEEMVTLFMMQILSPGGLPYGAEFQNLAYQAVID